MLWHVSTLDVCYLQEPRELLNMCSLCFILHGGNSADMINIIVMKNKNITILKSVCG